MRSGSTRAAALLPTRLAEGGDLLEELGTDQQRGVQVDAHALDDGAH